MIIDIFKYILIKILWGPVIRDLFMGPILVVKELFLYIKGDVR